MSASLAWAGRAGGRGRLSASLVCVCLQFSCPRVVHALLPLAPSLTPRDPHVGDRRWGQRGQPWVTARGGRPAWAAEGQGSYPEVRKMVGVTLDDGAGLLDVTGWMGPSTGPSHAHHRAGARLREEACRQSLLFFTPSPALSASAPAASEGSVLARTHSLRSHLRSSPSVPLSQASGAAFRCMRLPM